MNKTLLSLSLCCLITAFLPLHFFKHHRHHSNSKTQVSYFDDAKITAQDPTQVIEIKSQKATEDKKNIWSVAAPWITRKTNQKEFWELHANYATINLNNNTTVLREHVVGRSNVDKLSKISCEELVIDEQNKKYATVGNTHIITFHQLLISDNIQYDLTKNEIYLPTSGKLIYTKQD